MGRGRKQQLGGCRCLVVARKAYVGIEEIQLGGWWAYIRVRKSNLGSGSCQSGGRHK